MNFNEAEQFIQGLTDFEKKPGVLYTAATYDLKRLELLLDIMGNPHKDVKTVHIAGTKGKGSTAAMVASILKYSGYRVGLFTSPHLLTIRERIQVNNVLITEQEFADAVAGLVPAVEKINLENRYGKLTTFEVLAAAAFVFFKRNSVEFQVLEVGLGGRLDATNVAYGDICVIASISLDHMEVLGDTEEKIAAEKAGIIKQGSTVINFPQKPEVTRVVQNVCREKGADLIQLGSDISWERTGGDFTGQQFTVKTGSNTYDLSIPLLGDHQLENASAAVAVAEALSNKGARISAENLTAGLGRVQWQGRLQFLRYSPDVVADGAHNPYSMKVLAAAVKKYFTFESCTVIFGTSNDKDISGMVAEIKALTDNVIVTRSNHPRAADLQTLAAEFQKQGIAATLSNTVEQAIQEALSKSGRHDLIVVTGSLFIVAEAIVWANSLTYSDRTDS
jgi:dihydrofolate synthase / folylpolyglutamate synthase